MKFGVFQAPLCSSQTAPFLFNNYTQKGNVYISQIKLIPYAILKHFKIFQQTKTSGLA